jgi:hypothetical protein
MADGSAFGGDSGTSAARADEGGSVAAGGSADGRALTCDGASPWEAVVALGGAALGADE